MLKYITTGGNGYIVQRIQEFIILSFASALPVMIGSSGWLGLLVLA